MISNPILRGFNPDPSILRVGDDYYIATSTFEWYPGVQLHHSRDLVHWQAIGYALDRESQLDLGGIEASGGVWAPCLSYDEEARLFYLIYTIMRSTNGNFFDLDNYVVTASQITGPWSERTYLNSSGFDPSLFHDNDGRKWLLNLEWDNRLGYEHPGSIVIQEYDPEGRELIGSPASIFRGATDMGCLEAPHIYKRGDYYYMMAAEGGTGFGHGVTIARSKSLFGPYESDPRNPIITSAKEINLDRRGVDDYLKPYQYNPDSALQKSGHGSLVETPAGEPYIAHLCARPLASNRRSMLGRETAIQRCEWTEDGWLRLASGGQLAELEVLPPVAAVTAGTVGTTESRALTTIGTATVSELNRAAMAREHFDSGEWNLDLNSLRVPIDESWASLRARPGYLRLKGRNSLFSLHEQSLIARRLQSVRAVVETCVEFEPVNFHEAAGLTLFYDQSMFYYLRIYYSESLGGKCLGILYADNGVKVEMRETRLLIADWVRIYLRAVIDGEELRFYGSADGEAWTPIGPALDASKCSDEYSKHGHFTGAFVGICCQDSYRKRKHADFDYFEYRELDS